MGHQIGYWVGAAAALGLFILAARPPMPPRTTVDNQLFQMSLRMILSAHLFGPVDEAYTLRAIARTIQEYSQTELQLGRFLTGTDPPTILAGFCK